MKNKLKNKLVSMLILLIFISLAVGSVYAASLVGTVERQSPLYWTDNYGKDGYVVYAVDYPNFTWIGYDASSVITASPKSVVSLPSYITDISLPNVAGAWIGSNFGYIEDPRDGTLTITPILSKADATFTITGAADKVYRLTFLWGDTTGTMTKTVTVSDAGGTTLLPVYYFTGNNFALQSLDVQANAAGTVIVNIVTTVDSGACIAIFFDKPSAINVSPTPGETNVLIDANPTLQWKTGLLDPNSSVTDHLVYFGAGNPANMTLVSTQDVSDTDYYHGVLAKDTWQYWRVDEKIGPNPLTDPNDVIVGNVWSFQTELSLPKITKQPRNDSVAEGKPVMFTVEASGALTYEWKKEGDATVLSTTTELSFTMTASAAGDYYCIVSNTVGFTETNRATLTLGSEEGYWKLNGNGVDELGVYNATVPADQVWAGGAIPADDPNNRAASFDLDLLSDPIEFGNVPISDEFSLSLWFKPANINQDWRGIAGKQNPPFVNRVFWIGQHAADGYLRFGIFEGDAERAVDSSTAVLENGVWTHIVSVCTGEQLRLYVNGAISATRDEIIDNPPLDKASILTIGYAGYTIAGTIDEFHLYNYALDKFEVAELFLHGPADAICIERPELDRTGPDGKPDCVVNLYDFAEWASQWLQCGVYPDCY